MRVRRLTDSTSPPGRRPGTLLLLAAAVAYLLLPALLAGHQELVHNAVSAVVAEADQPADLPHDTDRECDQCILLGRLGAGDLPAPATVGVLIHAVQGTIGPIAEFRVGSNIPVAVLPRAPPLS